MPRDFPARAPSRRAVLERARREGIALSDDELERRTDCESLRRRAEADPETATLLLAFGELVVRDGQREDPDPDYLASEAATLAERCRSTPHAVQEVAGSLLERSRAGEAVLAQARPRKAAAKVRPSSSTCTGCLRTIQAQVTANDDGTFSLDLEDGEVFPVGTVPLAATASVQDITTAQDPDAVAIFLRFVNGDGSNGSHFATIWPGRAASLAIGDGMPPGMCGLPYVFAGPDAPSKIRLQGNGATTGGEFGGLTVFLTLALWDVS